MIDFRYLCVIIIYMTVTVILINNLVIFCGNTNTCKSHSFIYVL